MRILIGTILLGAAAAAAATITITPRSHDFGQAPLNGGPEQMFTITMSAPALASDSMRADVVGPDAADFEVDLTQPPGISALVPQSSCVKIWRTGTCQYLVRFRPKSLGPKSALLVVGIRPGYTANPAVLKGEGIFGCRPYLVPCNYADYYSGNLVIQTENAAPHGAHIGRWTTSIHVTVTKGVATCLVTQADWEEDHSGGVRRSRSTEQGTVHGPGLFAIEFTQTRSTGSLEYRLKFACPSPDLTSTFVDYIGGNSGPGHKDGLPAKWSNDLFADPQPATITGMKLLTGTQTDPYSNPGSNDGVSGSTTMSWSLIRK